MEGFFYELCDTIIQFQQSEINLQKLIYQLIKNDLVSHKMFFTSTKKFLANFEKFKTSKFILLLFQHRLNWLKTKIKDEHKIPGHPKVNKLLASNEDEWIYNVFNDSNHSKMTTGRLQLVFEKKDNDELISSFKSNKEEFELINAKINLFTYSLISQIHLFLKTQK